MTPEEAPPGVVIKYLPRPSGSAWTSWSSSHPKPMKLWQARPKMVPRLLLVHTNAANGEGNVTSSYNWAMAHPSNTKPHYQVDRSGIAHKFLPSDRVGIANHMASLFSLAIETADEGWGPGKPGGASGFTKAQAEMIAQIIAWESELWDFPIRYPNAWSETGVAAHTEPYGYPTWTNAIGKSCPGPTKKLELRTIIMPRARLIRFGKPIKSEDEMKEVYYTNAEARDWKGDTYSPRFIKYILMENGKVRRISGDELADRGHTNVDLEFGIPKTNEYLNSLGES